MFITNTDQVYRLHLSEAPFLQDGAVRSICKSCSHNSLRSSGRTLSKWVTNTPRLWHRLCNTKSRRASSVTDRTGKRCFENVLNGGPTMTIATTTATETRTTSNEVRRYHRASATDARCPAGRKLKMCSRALAGFATRVLVPVLIFAVFAASVIAAEWWSPKDQPSIEPDQPTPVSPERQQPSNPTSLLVDNDLLDTQVAATIHSKSE